MKLTTHQTHVLLALHGLEQRRSIRWWNRYAIGSVVYAGGYHQVIQIRTMDALKRAGLVQTERSSWPAHVQEIVRCSCACAEWGLTDAGRRIVERIPVRWTEKAEKAIATAFRFHDREMILDETDARYHHPLNPEP
jgi:hypothetical protein